MKTYLLRLVACNATVIIGEFAPLWATDCNWTTYNASYNAWLEPRLDLRWPACVGNTSELHREQWDRHGTCTKMPQSGYFATALDLWDGYHDFGAVDVCLDLGLNRVDCPGITRPRRAPPASSEAASASAG